MVGVGALGLGLGLGLELGSGLGSGLGLLPHAIARHDHEGVAFLHLVRVHG